MGPKNMDLQEYCGLNRPRFRLEPEGDAEWYFGNEEVSDELLTRIRSDFLIRGVPKCGVVGRFGQGKTHTLFHLKYLFDSYQDEFPAIPFFFRIAPYDESTPGLGGWSYIHSKMLDAMGEKFLRSLVVEFDRLPEDRTRGLANVMVEEFRFGSENLQQSLANLLSAYFLRDGRSTMSAWEWLRGKKPSGKELQECGVNVWLEHAGDMVDIILNLGALTRKTFDAGLCFLMDEGQALGEVDKRHIEIHDTLLQISEPDNEDVGFVMALFGTGQSAIPDVIINPPDLLSRLGVSSLNIHEAFIDLRRIINSEEDLKGFIADFLSHIKDRDKAIEIMNKFNIENTTWDFLPFTQKAIDRIVEILFQDEQQRNPRMIINNLARVSAVAYQKAKQLDQYIIADVDIVNTELKDIS